MIIFSNRSVQADFTFGEPRNLGPAINCDFDESGASLSADGLSLFFDSDYPRGSDWDLEGDWNLFVVTRETLDDRWGQPVSLGPAVNSPDVSEWDPSISSDGLELYFTRGSRTHRKDVHHDLYVVARGTTQSQWSDAANLGETVNTPGNEGGASISADGLSLYVAVTSASDDFAPSIASDDLTLIFSSTRPGKYCRYADIWMVRRRTPSDPWGEPFNLGPIVNTRDVHYADISPDGRTLYLSCFNRYGGFGLYDMWQASIIPIVDLDGDGIVNIADMGIMVDFWGTDEPLCDIGPMPWGDGIVDVQDLIVLAEYLFEEVPPVK
jgi:hypothetical protein